MTYACERKASIHILQASSTADNKDVDIPSGAASKYWAFCTPEVSLVGLGLRRWYPHQGLLHGMTHPFEVGHPSSHQGRKDAVQAGGAVQCHCTSNGPLHSLAHVTWLILRVTLGCTGPTAAEGVCICSKSGMLIVSAALLTWAVQHCSSGVRAKRSVSMDRHSTNACT